MYIIRMKALAFINIMQPLAKAMKSLRYLGNKISKMIMKELPSINQLIAQAILWFPISKTILLIYILEKAMPEIRTNIRG